MIIESFLGKKEKQYDFQKFATLKELSLSEQKKIVQLALTYPPATRALVGALFELLGNDLAATKLYKTLNPLSSYKLGIREEILPNKNKWKIE